VFTDDLSAVAIHLVTFLDLYDACKYFLSILIFGGHVTTCIMTSTLGYDIQSAAKRIVDDLPHVSWAYPEVLLTSYFCCCDISVGLNKKSVFLTL
jgi:hypothetical protein